MGSLSKKLLDKAVIGTQAGWALAFYKVEGGKIEKKPLHVISREDYLGDISATLPSGLEGGSYVFAIEGLTDDDYAKISQKNPRNNDFLTKFVRLYLFWYDRWEGFLESIPILSTVSQLIGGDNYVLPPDYSLVAELAVTRISRKAGERRYVTTIEAREYVYDVLTRKCLSAADANDENLRNALLVDAASLLMSKAGLVERCVTYTVEGEQASKQIYEQNTSYRTLFKSLGTAMEKVSRKFGRGMFLVRNGKLHIGPRGIPLATEEGSDPKSVTTSNGFLEAEPIDKVSSDPNDSEGTDCKPLQQRYKITLMGRPDIKPGDVIEFAAPSDKPAAPGPGGIYAEMFSAVTDGAGDTGTETKVYVEGVANILNQAKGFITTITGVSIANTKDGWDEYSPAHVDSDKKKCSDDSGESRAAQATIGMIKELAKSRRLPEVGEVRKVTSSTGGTASSQTEEVWAGLKAPDGKPDRANRLPIMRPSPLPLEKTPYLSPYAWGKYGLVLPRYPGTRVVLAFRNGDVNDAVDIGALWEADKGPDSQAGDWWLILPVGIDASKRSEAAGDNKPEEHTGPASQDLIDAEGNRIIEVGELTIRVTRSKLTGAGQRPARGGTADAITIEHADGEASLIIKNDGTIEITAKKLAINAGSGDIEMTTAGNVTIEGANINLKGAKVDVGT